MWMQLEYFIGHLYKVHIHWSSVAPFVWKVSWLCIYWHNSTGASSGKHYPPPLGKYLSMCYIQKITEAVELTQRANICIIKFAKNYWENNSKGFSAKKLDERVILVIRGQS